MIDPELLRVWLQEVPNDLSMEFVEGPRVPEFLRGDDIGVVTMLEGPGYTLEGSGGFGSFQLRLVARERDQDKLRRTAFQLDNALLFGDYPVDIWGTWITSVDRTGGEPSPLQEDEHDRVAYVCSYIAHETVER
jgi:hypothetical protein